MIALVLASSSIYRRELLTRLGLPFTTAVPAIDETPAADESADALVARLAEQKARAVTPPETPALVIGSDQVALLDGEVLGKPGSAEANRAQLRALSGREARFLTGVCVWRAPDGPALTEVVVNPVRFRDLDEREIAAYVQAEAPFDCAGGFKSEGLGIALFDGIGGDDPTALIGLPLIALCRLLRRQGLDPLRTRSG